MNPYQEREQMINILLQSCDAKNKVIAGLQAKLAEFEKAAEEKAAKKAAKKADVEQS